MFRKDILANAPASRSFTLGGHQFKVPIHYRRLDCFFAIFGADTDALKRLLPSLRLRPIPIWPGRSLLALNAFNYLDTDIGPYGEFSVGIPCSLARPAKWPAFGIYIHRLPVTSELGKVAGIEVWGYPKFVCEMQFQNTGMVNSVKLSRDGKTILELSIKKAGLGIGAAVNLNTFTVKDGVILQTRIMSSSVVRVSPNGLAALKLGDHEMAAELAALNLAKRPLGTGDLLDANMLLPLGNPAGPIHRVSGPDPISPQPAPAG